MQLRLIDEDGLGGDFIAPMNAQATALGITLALPGAGGAADVCVVFAGPTMGYPAETDAYLAQGTPVFAVVATAADAAVLPGNLSERNAFVRDRYGRTWPHALWDEIVARVWLPRRRRKLFISYRRADSIEVAHQLHDTLTVHGFEVFLDEATIARSDDIRAELEWSLSDADAVILLATPDVAKSQWVLDEIAFANSRGIAVIGVCGPGAPPGLLTPDQQVRLAIDPIVTLDAPTLEQVLGAVFERRAVAIKTRLEQLVPIVSAVARPKRPARTHQHRLQGVGDLESTIAPAAFVRVLPHRPTPDDLHDAAETAAVAVSRSAEVVCVYSECHRHHPSVMALEWLFGPKRTPPCILWPYTGKIP